MNIHKDIIAPVVQPKITVVELHNVIFAPGIFATLLESLRLRGLLDASGSQPSSGENGFYVWASRINPQLQVRTSHHPYVSRVPMSVQLVGTANQIRETMMVLNSTGVQGITESFDQIKEAEVDIPYHTTLNEVIWNHSGDEYMMKDDIRATLLEGANH